MWIWKGNPFAGLEAQEYWQVHSVSNLWNVPKFVLLLYALPQLWRMGMDLISWMMLLALLPAMSGTFVSFLRFESYAFPLFLAGAAVFTGRKRKWPLAAALIVSFLLHAVLLWRFLNYRCAG